jgi:hypothetical protein
VIQFFCLVSAEYPRGWFGYLQLLNQYQLEDRQEQLECILHIRSTVGGLKGNKS